MQRRSLMAHPQSKHPPSPDLVDLLRRAAAHHQRGEMREAEDLYRQVLAAQPDNFDALHLYGVLMHQRGRAAEALKLIGQALAANARAAPAHSNYGIVLTVLKRHEEALASYERAIALKPDYADAFNNRGNALRALRRNEEALASYERALVLRPDNAEALNNRGNALFELGRPEDALASYDQVLAHRPDYADALVNRAKCLIALKRTDDALASFDRALACQPRHAAALKERGHLLRDRKQFVEALSCYDRALAVTPDDAEIHANRGRVLRDLKRFNEAFVAYDRALALRPDYVEAVVARGNVFYEMGAYAQALAEYDRALAMRPDFAQGHNNRGNALRELSRHEEAIDCFDRALALKPDYTDGYNNRGNALLDLNRPAEALADYDRALALDRNSTFALVNRGSALRYLDRDDEALASFDRAITIEPDLADAHWNKALLCLSRGDFARGWQGYEWRWQRGGELVPRGFTQPQWRSEELAGKIILLHAEQGFGDSIQFVRYLPMVKAKGGKVVLELPDSLMPLMGDHAAGVTMLSRGTPLPPFDVHCPLMSLPLAFGTTLATIPDSVPYLRVPADRLEKWRARLPRTAKPRVGLVWSGKPSHKNDHNRSIALARLAPLLTVPGVDFVSLQREYHEADLSAFKDFPALMRIDAHLTDFADTAAAIAQLDLVIAVDTAVAHLAGALNMPVWILLFHIQDWRWLLERADSPWYPSARLFRQPQIGDWDSVIARLGSELGAFAAKLPGATS
jgi:tetratricopeptide (TPR) repeat protein